MYVKSNTKMELVYKWFTTHKFYSKSLQTSSLRRPTERGAAGPNGVCVMSAAMTNESVEEDVF